MKKISFQKIFYFFNKIYITEKNSSTIGSNVLKNEQNRKFN